MTLQQVFSAYAKAPDMDGRTFVKLLKDVKIIDNKFTATDADLIFARVKAKASRKITLPQLEQAMQMVADRKQVPVDEVVSKVLESKGPEFKGTVAEATKFHDDKSLYTGVHQYGGPSTVDKGRTAISDLSELTDRSAYNIRGVNKAIASKVEGQHNTKPKE